MKFEKFDPVVALHLSRVLTNDPAPSDSDIDRAAKQLQAACDHWYAHGTANHVA